MVLKNHNRDLMVDFQGLRDQVPTITLQYATWTQLGQPARVVSSEEEPTRRRPRTGQTSSSTRMWATTLNHTELDTAKVVELGHRRWDIENHGFNELVT